MLLYQINNEGFFLFLMFGLTHPHANTRSTKGNDAGDLKRSATLRAHQAVPRLQAARRTAFLRAFAFCVLVFLWLSLPRVMVFFIPFFARTSSHDADLFRQESKSILWCQDRWLKSVNKAEGIK